MASAATPPLPPGHPDNLHAPVPGDHGAHGRFDHGARRTSWQWWLHHHAPEAIATLTAGLLALALALVLR